jgi:parvulin-like peptidyl-prolyl isomerase
MCKCVVAPGEKRRRAFVRRACRAGCCALVLLCVSSCKRAGDAPADPVVAVVGREKITASAFRARMAERGGRIEGTYTNLAEKRDLLEEMIRFEVLVESARRAGTFDDPEMQRKIKQLAVSRIEQNIAGEVGEAEALTEEEVTAYYEQQAASLARPERIKVAFILIQVPPKVSPEKKAELAQRAEEARKEAEALDRTVRNFGYLAAKYSEDQPTRYKGGESGWLSREQPSQRWGKEMVERLFALGEPGAMTPVLETDEGLWIFRLIECESAAAVPLERVELNLRKRMIEERIAARLDHLVESTAGSLKITVDEKALDAVPVPDRTQPDPRTPQTPPALPSG